MLSSSAATNEPDRREKCKTVKTKARESSEETESEEKKKEREKKKRKLGTLSSVVFYPFTTAIGLSLMHFFDIPAL